MGEVLDRSRPVSLSAASLMVVGSALPSDLSLRGWRCYVQGRRRRCCQCICLGR